MQRFAHGSGVVLPYLSVQDVGRKVCFGFGFSILPTVRYAIP